MLRAFYVLMTGLLVVASVALIWRVDFAHAAAPVIDSAPPCTPIAATGNIVISRCVDEETGQVLYVNNIGFMVLGE